ncbi:MAG: hypothetical protein PSV35_04990, partial [bacterium]|nr:hypothetical protein [bacterium]
NLPDIYINGAHHNHPGYHLLKLPADDYHAFFLGYIVNCCQSMGRAAEQVVLDAWSMADRGFYVLIKENKYIKGKNPTHDELLNSKNANIIGQCFAWLSDKGNLVIDSWDNLMTEHDEIAESMLRDFANQVINKPQYHVFRVTVGASGGKTPLTLKKHLTDETETTSRGLHHKDSKTQAEICSRNVSDWEKSLYTWLQEIPSLPQPKKQQLMELRQKSAHYQDLLQVFLNDAILEQYLQKNVPPMDSLIVLYVLLRKQPEYFNLILHELLQCIPAKQMNTQRMGLNILFISRLVLGSSLAITPELLQAMGSMLQQLNSLNPNDLESLFVKLKDTKDTPFITACSINKDLLNNVLNHISIKQSQALILERRGGKNCLYEASKNPQLLKLFLDKLPEKSRLQAISKRGRNDKPLLHVAIGTPESVRLILKAYPLKQRSGAIKQIYGGEWNSSLHLATSHLESCVMMLDSLDNSAECFDVLSKINKAGQTVLTMATSNPELFVALIHYLPTHALTLISELNDKNLINLLSKDLLNAEQVKHLATTPISLPVINALLLTTPARSKEILISVLTNKNVNLSDKQLVLIAQRTTDAVVLANILAKKSEDVTIKCAVLQNPASNTLLTQFSNSVLTSAVRELLINNNNCPINVLINIASSIKTLSLKEQIQIVQHAHVDESLLLYMITHTQYSELLISLSASLSPEQFSDTLSQAIIDSPHVQCDALINLINRNYCVAALRKLLSLDVEINYNRIFVNSLTQLTQDDAFNQLEEIELIKILNRIDDINLHQKLIAHPQASSTFTKELANKTANCHIIEILLQSLKEHGDNEEILSALLKQKELSAKQLDFIIKQNKSPQIFNEILLMVDKLNKDHYQTLIQNPYLTQNAQLLRIVEQCTDRATLNIVFEKIASQPQITYPHKKNDQGTIAGDHCSFLPLLIALAAKMLEHSIEEAYWQLIKRIAYISPRHLSCEQAITLVAQNMLAPKEAINQFEPLLPIKIIKSFMEQIINCIKLINNTITSNRFIFWSTHSKESKDNSLATGLYNLNLALVKEDELLIKNNFTQLSKIACQKRNKLSAILMGDY